MNNFYRYAAYVFYFVVSGVMPTHLFVSISIEEKWGYPPILIGISMLLIFSLWGVWDARSEFPLVKNPLNTVLASLAVNCVATIVFWVTITLKPAMGKTHGLSWYGSGYVPHPVSLLMFAALILLVQFYLKPKLSKLHKAT